MKTGKKKMEKVKTSKNGSPWGHSYPSFTPSEKKSVEI